MNTFKWSINHYYKRIDGPHGPSVNRVHVSGVSCFSHLRHINVAYLLYYPIKLIMKKGIVVIGTF